MIPIILSIIHLFIGIEAFRKGEIRVSKTINFGGRAAQITGIIFLVTAPFVLLIPNIYCSLGLTGFCILISLACGKFVKNVSPVVYKKEKKAKKRVDKKAEKKEEKTPSDDKKYLTMIFAGLVINIVLVLVNVVLFSKHVGTKGAKEEQTSVASELKVIDGKLQNLKKRIDEAGASITPLEQLKEDFSVKLETPLGLIGSQVNDINNSLAKWQGKKVEDESEDNK